MLKSNLDKVYKITKKRKNKRRLLRDERQTKKLLNILKFVKSKLDAFGFKNQPVVLQEQAGDDIKSKNPSSNQGNTTSTKATTNFISSDPINEEEKKQQQ